MQWDSKQQSSQPRRLYRGRWYAERYDPLQAGSIDATDTVPHDHAIKRAIAANYRKPDEYDVISTDPERTLFIGHLTPSMTSDDLVASLSHYGAIEKAIVVRNKVTGISRRYGFVTFQDQQSALELFKASRRHTISVRFRRQSTIASRTRSTNILDSTAEDSTTDKASLDTNQDEASGIDGLDPFLDSSTVLVDFERSRVMEGWVPRRLGGGIGGKKESGQLRFGGGIRPFSFPIGDDLKFPREAKNELCWHPILKGDRQKKMVTEDRNRHN